MSMIASVLCLDRKDIKALRITDPYSLHRVVYSLYGDVRNEAEKGASQASGILYADLGGDAMVRRVLLLANREPVLCLERQFGRVESKVVPPSFLSHKQYRFKVIINPTRRDSSSRKLLPVRGREEIAEWFADRASKNWGFSVIRKHLQVDKVELLQFKAKHGNQVLISQAFIQGVLSVKDQSRFQESFSQGIGRARAFGCGLLQLVPTI